MEFPYKNWESVSRFWTWKFRNGFIFVPLSYLSFIVVVQIPVSVILSVLTQRVSNIGPRNSLNVLLVLLSRDFIRKIINPGLSEIILGKPKMSQCPGLPRQVLLTICSLLNLPHYLHLLPLASHNPAWCICWVTQSRRLLETPWTIAHKALLSMGFFRQGYWRELPFPLPEDIPDPGIKPASPALAGIFFTTLPPGKLISMHDFYLEIFIDLFGCVRSYMRHAGSFIIAYKLLSVPWPGTEPRPLLLEAWSLSHWTTREVPMHNLSNAVCSIEITGHVRMKPIEGTGNRFTSSRWWN